MSFYLSEKAYNQIIGNTSKSKEESTPYLGIETTPAKPEQQGIIGDVVDSVQMGAWKGLSDLAHGLGAITGADWLHKAGDLAAKGADENMATMSDEMKAALNQSALDGEGKGIANIRWWAGNLGSILGQNLDTVLTLGFGKVATIGVKQAGKMLLKREAAEQVGKIAVEQAAKRGVPQKYLDMVGYTAIQTAMSGGSRYGQKRDEVMAMDNETLAKLPEFSNAYYEIADSDEGKDKTVEELYSLAKTRFADKVGQSAALNPTAIMTDIGVNAISGLGGGFKGLLSPAQTVKGGLVKGALIEGGTEAVQGVAEQYALNQAQKEYIDPNQNLTEGMQENAINGAILGGVFGGMMGGIDSHSHRRELNQQKRTILEHINTGDVEIDEKLRRYTDSINQSATDLADLVKMSQVQRWNNQGQAFREKQQQQAQRAQFESDFFGEEQAEAQAENIEPEFKPDSNLDRALDLHLILTQFRKNDFSRANEFIDTPMVFSDEQAKKDHVTEKALTEVRNIAQQYGINPQDGKAMRQWLEDYAEEVEKYRDNNKSASPENNVQFSENFSPDKEQMATEFKPQPMNLNEEAAFELHTNSSIDSRNEMGETTDTFEQPTQQDNPEITLDQSPFEEAKNITSQIQENVDGSVSDDSQSVFTPENNIDDEFKTYSRSAMKSVESNIKRGREAMNAAITEKRTVHRAMFNHNLDGWVDFEWGDDGLTKSFNKKGEPVGKGISHIIEARMRKDGMSYEQVTKMLTRDIVDTIAKGSIVGHWVRNDGKSESIQIDHNGYRAGLIRNKGSNAWLLTAFELYPADVDSAGSVDAEKTTHFKPTLTRQEMGAASIDNVQQSNFQRNQQSQFQPMNQSRGATTSDLHANSPIRSRTETGATGTENIHQLSPQHNQEIEQAHQILKQTFGNASEHIDVTTFANPPEDVKNLITSDVEGWFNPKTGKITIVADSIKATKSMSRKERLQFVAWHEMAHRGINVEFKEDYHSVMQEVGKNKMVSNIADAIQTQRKGTDDLSVTNRTVAIEEALAEIMAAQETGKWEELQQRYGVSFHKGQMKSARAWLEMTAERLRNFITKLFGHETVQRMSNQEVLNLVKRIKQSAVKTEQVSSNSEIRFSLNENADSDFAKAVDDVANGKFSSQIIEVGTTPSVLKMLGLPDANVVISGSVLKKVMLGKHNVTPDTLKQLPKQINDPVAVMKSSTQQNGYVVLTELTENVNGVNKPVVAALHLKQTSQGIELINIASVYGRNNSQIQRGLENDLLYWNKKKGVNFLDNLTLQLRSPLSETNSTKGTNLIDTFGLQLPAYVSERSPLLGKNLKTEVDLSQYQSENADVLFSRNEELTKEYYNQAKENAETELTFHQWKQVRSPEFKAWFGDWENDPENASKVVNERTGEPLVAYHGTGAEFNVFDKNKAGAGNDKGLRGKGFYFSPNRTTSESYGEKIIGAYVSLKNPFRPSDFTSAEEVAKHLTNKLSEQGYEDYTVDPFIFNVGNSFSVRSQYAGALSSILKDAGYDGILYPNRQEIVAFDSNQIKSATDNTGTFSKENDDIRFSRAQSRSKAESLEKLREAETIRISGREIESSEDLRQYKSNTLAYGKNLRGAYVNKDTGREISLGRNGVTEVLRHDYKDREHLQSIAAIPQIIENSIYIDTLPNEDLAKNPDIKEYEYYIAGLNIGGVDYTVRAAIGVGRNGNRYYDHKLTQIEKGKLLSLLDRVSTTGASESNSPLSEVNDKRLLQILQDAQGENRINGENSDIRFSRANTTQSARNLAKTGKAQTEPSLWDNLMRGDLNGFKRAFHQTVSKLDEYLADSLRPVNDWIDNLSLADQTGNTSSRDHEKRRLKDAMYTAKGKRDAMNSELEQAYLKPILSKIAAMSKATKKTGHYIDELTMKRMVGNWISARYAIEKNRELLARDKATMDDAKRQLDDARQQGANSETINRLNNAYLKAKAQYDDRKADIHNTDYDNEKRFKVGGAGGWSIPEAQDIMNDTERYLSRAQLEEVANLIYDLNQAKLDIDRASGRFTDKEYQQYKANRHYVPLTGDPNADIDSDIISGAGSSAVNIGRDKTMKGRTNSEAEDAIDAVWKSVGKSTTYAGFAEFKSRIDDLYETEVALLKNKGFSLQQAQAQARANLGIDKQKMQGLTRSSDDVLIRKQGGEYFEYRLPTQIMEALRNDNVEHANAFLKVISKPTGWYARGVTQWTVTFAPMNMLRDTWEKSEFIRVQKLYDKNNRLVDSKTMDKIGRDTIKNALTNKEVWNATKRLGFGQELRDSVPVERMLKQLLREGGISNYGTYLDKSEVDLIKKLRKENNPIASKLEKAGKILEGYNKTFDTVSALASYKALIENGIDPKQAAATTLELTNFRKTGSKMRGIKALYMFSQPTVMGAANLMRYLSTRKGQIRFIGYMAVMTSLYTVLRSMDDEDEGGNKMDQLGDITRYIPIPLGEGKYFKIPVGFGMAQMAWNFATNIVKGAVGDISLTEAGANMLAHSLKTFAPISPSEISAAKYPMEKAALTITPTLLQPLVQNVINRSAFGSQITTNYVRDDKLKAEQSKATTAQFWKDTALFMNDNLGIDMHPEQIKNLFDGYSSMFGSLKELSTIFVENPNREALGRKTKMPFISQFIGTTNEFSIQSRYYEASEEAGSVYKEYKSRKERNELGNWLDADKMKLIKFHEQEESIVKKARSEKANLTRLLRSGKISAIAYENGIKRYNKDMSRVQAKMLHKYRIMEGLNTN
ncbi:MuF-C-terminal domain-containing protein [Haemophilus haemolyticus]|uniref:MuF-C-terminal domain-containing protein n=1 Tax=Haemophilus haemolyticus TaxID=726 RepID=UPI001C6121D5|nr:LPD38 domain-containing protein [Haemophilus haemolyticus]